MGLYRDLASALERNGFYESLVNEEYAHGVFIIPTDSSAANAKMEYWSDILDYELGGNWWSEVDMYLGKNPNPSTGYLHPDAIIIELA